MMVDKAQLFAVANQVFNDEIEGIKQVARNLDQSFLKSVELLLNCRGKVVVTGMGKSGHVAGKIAATLASTGTPAFFVHPAEALHGDLGMIDNKDVVLAISYSGESDELISILPVLKHKQVSILAITGNLESSLAKFADYILNIKVSKEACPLNLAPTTTTTVSLVVGDALAISLLTLRGFKKEDFALSHPGGSLGRQLLTTVKDLMHSGDKLPVVMMDTPLKHVVIEISNKGLGFTAVVDVAGKLVGIITDGDLRRLLDHEVDIIHTKAAEVMSKSPKTVSVDSLAVAAIELMEQYKITGFLVVDAFNSLVGAFNLHDLFKAKLI
ncbi:MAG: SIS domain-containing protein [Burkholderiales bacterium]